MAALKRAYYAKSPDRDKEYVKRWRAANPDKVADANRRQRERRASAVVQDVRSANEYALILRRDPCCYCGASGRLEVDHIEPLSVGGGGEWHNLTGACAGCNRSKKARSLLGYLLDA